MATARDDEGLIVKLLDAGADDYVVKPARPGPSGGPHPRVLRRAGAAVTTKSSRPAAEGRRPDRRPGQKDSRHRRPVLDLTAWSSMCSPIWPAIPASDQPQGTAAKVWQRTDSARTVDVHLSWLRRKLGDNVGIPRFLHVHRGVGIMLEDARTPAGNHA